MTSPAPPTSVAKRRTLLLLAVAATSCLAATVVVAQRASRRCSGTLALVPGRFERAELVKIPVVAKATTESHTSSSGWINLFDEIYTTDIMRVGDFRLRLDDRSYHGRPGASPVVVTDPESCDGRSIALPTSIYVVPQCLNLRQRPGTDEYAVTCDDMAGEVGTVEGAMFRIQPPGTTRRLERYLGRTLAAAIGCIATVVAEFDIRRARVDRARRLIAVALALACGALVAGVVLGN